jgi:Iron-containing redox enzyme
MRRDYVTDMERDLAGWVDAMDRDLVVGRVIRGDASREEYVRFLWSTYHYLRWSGRLLAETADGLRREGRYPWLVEVVDDKTVEEGPHDAWLLHDLEQCGVDGERVVDSPAPSAVRAYVQWGLAMAEDGSPAYLGAAFALEYISMRRAGVAADNLRRRRAIPNIENAVSFLVGHGDADQGHVAVLGELLRRIEEPRERGAIALSATVLRALYPRFFRSRGPAETRGAATDSRAGHATASEGAASCERSPV